MSRSAFAARFTELVGEPAMHYVARWRMHLALDALSERRRHVGELAGRLGYRSEAAFARAFKRVVGIPPGAVKRAPDALYLATAGTLPTVEDVRRDRREPVHRSRKPVPSVSRGSSRKRCSPVRNAVPETSVSTPSATSPIAWAWKLVPAIESLRQVSPMPISPSASSNVVRADVADPVGERSTSPSAKIATLRWWRGPTRSVSDGAVDAR